jgi:ABC-type proline/glycine betaine transport system ATPase subunit
MPSALRFREDVRALARRSKDVNQSRRLPSLAAVRDGMDRGSAAKIGGIDRQTLRSCVRMIPGEKLRQSIGYVIQGHGLFPHWTVARNIPIVPRLLNWDARATHKQLAEPSRLRACRAAKSRFPHEIVRASEIGPSSCGPIS